MDTEARLSCHMNTALATGDVRDAIVLTDIWGWVKYNKRNDKNYFDGRYWMYNSNAAFQEQYPIWSAKQIRGILTRLVNNGFLLEGVYNSMPFDRTKWYTVTEKAVAVLCPQGDAGVALQGGSDLPSGANDNCPTGQTNTNYINNMLNNTMGAAPPSKAKKKAFTPPTIAEIDAYCKEKGFSFDTKQFFDYYAAADWHDSKGQPVKNWKQRVVTWAGHHNYGGNNGAASTTRKPLPVRKLNEFDLAEFASIYGRQGS